MGHCTDTPHILSKCLTMLIYVSGYDVYVPHNLMKEIKITHFCLEQIQSIKNIVYKK